MKIQIKYENLLPAEHEAAKDAIAKIRDAVAGKLPNTEPDLQRLEGHIRKAPKGHRFAVSLRLHLPLATLVVRKEKTDLPALWASARDDLLRQVRRYLARLHNIHSWRKTVRQGQLASRKAIKTDERLRERHALFFDVMEEHFDLLWNYAWRELAYLEANGDLPPGALSVQDVVDAILLAGVDKFEKRPSEFDVTDWLLRLSIETLEAQARQIANAMPADAEALDQAAPEPATDPTESDQEFYEFYQPDDAPTLENLIPYPEEVTAEDRVAKHETALAVHRALACLPRLWRHAMILVHAEDLPQEQVAEILGISPVELSDVLKDAVRFLKARLEEGRGMVELQGDAELQAVLRGVGKAKPAKNVLEATVTRFQEDTCP